jgi:pimeloyl-ACP methyl ester carboxylesterase
VHYEEAGTGNEPLVCLPGGPLRSMRYFGDLGGLSAHRRLLLVELPRRRVDRIVTDIEALRVHLGHEQLDVLAHSAGASLALLYAARCPHCVRAMALITPALRAMGIQSTEQQWHEALERRSNEPWFPHARAALASWENGDHSPQNRADVSPFFYGRWDDVSRAHAAAEPEQTSGDGASIYYAEGALDVASTREALAFLAVPIFILVGELDLQPTLHEAQELASLLPQARISVQDRAGHYPWLDDAETFVDAVAAFFGESDSEPTPAG